MMMPSPDAVLALIGEFELMGERQKQFMENFQLKAMFASMSYCRKLLAKPYPMIPFPKRNLPTMEDCKRMYDER